MLSNQVRPLSERASSQQLAGHSAATSEWPCLEQTYSGPAVRGPNKPMADCPLSQLRNSVSSNLIFGQQQPQLANDYSARGHSASRQLGHQAEMGALHVEPSEAPTDWPGAAEEDKVGGVGAILAPSKALANSGLSGGQHAGGHGGELKRRHSQLDPSASWRALPLACSPLRAHTSARTARQVSDDVSAPMICNTQLEARPAANVDGPNR